MTILGVDPGLAGALAVLTDHGELVAVVDMPVAGVGAQRRVDAANLADVIRQHEVSFAIVEQVASRPGQGVASTFKFGAALGTVTGVLGALQVPVRWASPSAWKRATGLSGDKEASRQRAIETWPRHAGLFARKAAHGRAEAALLALWAIAATRTSRDAA